MVSHLMLHVQSLQTTWKFSQLLSPELHLSTFSSIRHHTLGLAFVLITAVMIHLG